MILQRISSGYQQSRATVSHSSRGLLQEEKREVPSDVSDKSDGERTHTRNERLHGKHGIWYSTRWSRDLGLCRVLI
jgi:transposase